MAVLVVIIIVVIIIYIQKKGGFKSWMTSRNAPPITATSSAAPMAPTPNLLTQAATVKQFPTDGQGIPWKTGYTVPNISYADRFQPGDTWVKDSDGSSWTRQGNTAVQMNAGFTPTGGSTTNKAEAFLLALNPFTSNQVGKATTQNGVTTATQSKPYRDSDWDFGSVRGDMNSDGTATEQWNATPLGQARAQMLTNMSNIQKAYLDCLIFGGVNGTWPGATPGDQDTDRQNITTIYGTDSTKWPKWATAQMGSYVPPGGSMYVAGPNGQSIQVAAPTDAANTGTVTLQSGGAIDLSKTGVNLNNLSSIFSSSNK